MLGANAEEGGCEKREEGQGGRARDYGTSQDDWPFKRGTGKNLYIW